MKIKFKQHNPIKSHCLMHFFLVLQDDPSSVQSPQVVRMVMIYFL